MARTAEANSACFRVTSMSRALALIEVADSSDGATGPAKPTVTKRLSGTRATEAITLQAVEYTGVALSVGRRGSS